MEIRHLDFGFSAIQNFFKVAAEQLQRKYPRENSYFFCTNSQLIQSQTIAQRQTNSNACLNRGACGGGVEKISRFYKLIIATFLLLGVAPNCLAYQTAKSEWIINLELQTLAKEFDIVNLLEKNNQDVKMNFANSVCEDDSMFLRYGYALNVTNNYQDSVDALKDEDKNEIWTMSYIPVWANPYLEQYLSMDIKYDDFYFSKNFVRYPVLMRSCYDSHKHIPRDKCMTKFYDLSVRCVRPKIMVALTPGKESNTPFEEIFVHASTEKMEEFSDRGLSYYRDDARNFLLILFLSLVVIGYVTYQRSH